MPTPFTLTHTTPLPAHLPPTPILSTLHNHPHLMSHNPLIVSWSPLAPSSLPPHIPENERHTWTWYHVTDRIPILPGVGDWGCKTVGYEAGFCDVEEGVRTHVFAPMGVEIRALWRVLEEGDQREEGEGQGRGQGQGQGQGGQKRWVLNETTTVECGWMVAGFVKKNIVQSHREGAEKVLAEAVRVMGEASGANGDGEAF